METRRVALYLMVGLVVTQAALTLLWVRPGPLSIDEVIYQWMARAAAEGHPLTLGNGYREMPSPELATVRYMRTTGGQLTAQYPLFFPLAALPFYGLAGFLGLFLMNALAFVGVVWLTWRVAARLTGRAGVAAAAAAILALGTFAWEYSMAAWPHMATLLLLMGAFERMLAAVMGPGPGAGGAADERSAGQTECSARTRAALTSGLLLGIAVGFRRDAVFFLPVVALPVLFATLPRKRDTLLAMAAGLALPLAALAVLNGLRWGIWSPLSYGRPEPRYRILGFLAALGALGAAVLAAPRVRDRVLALARRRLPLLVLAAGIVVLVLLLTPATRGRMLRMTSGIESLLFDLRGSGTEFAGSDDVYYWAVLYAGGVKKALLQSLPWLPVLAVGFRGARHDPGRRRTLGLLLLPVVITLGVHIVFDRHGGMGLNLRYYLPALPFLAILAAVSLADVVHGVREAGDARWAAVGGGALAAGTWLLLRPAGFDEPRAAETAVLDAPLLLAGVVAAATVAWLAMRRRIERRGHVRAAHRVVATGAVVATTAAGLVWSAALAFDYDARWSREVRTENLVRSLRVAEHVPEGALLFGQFPDWHGTVPELRDGVIVAYPRVDDYADFRALAFHHLDADRPVYAALAPYEWATLGARGALEGLEWRVVADGEEPVLQLRRTEGGPPTAP